MLIPGDICGIHKVRPTKLFRGHNRGKANLEGTTDSNNQNRQSEQHLIDNDTTSSNPRKQQ